MANVRVKDQQKGSPRAAEVGEVDTRAPFQSVKAAVSLFGAVVSKGRNKSSNANPNANANPNTDANTNPNTPKKKLSESNALDRETQLLLAQKEINKIKQQLESAQTTKARALSELDKAKRTLDDLNARLKSVSDSKKSAIKDAEEIKSRAKKLEEVKSKETIQGGAWKQELDHDRKEYSVTVTQLDAAKQELTKIRQDFDAALEAKLAAFQQAAEAQRAANVNSDRVTELSKEVAAMQGSIEQLKLASQQAQQQQLNAVAEKEAYLKSYKTAKQEAEEKLLSLKSEVDPELANELEAKLEETSSEIEVIQQKMRKAHASEMDSVRVVTMELSETTKMLQKVADEESSLRSVVSSLRLELEDLRREQTELKDKEMEMEALATKLTDQIQKEKEEAEAKLKSPPSPSHQEVDHSSTVQKLSSETESARLEAQEMMQNAEQQKREAQDTRVAAEEAEKKLKIALEEAKEAKEAEKRALDELKLASSSSGGGAQEEDGSCSNSESSVSGEKKIKLSPEDYESMKRKVEECEKLAERKVAESMAQVEVINARKNEADKKLGANLKAIEEIKTATDMAVNKAEMAESAKSAVEGELRKRRQEEEPVTGESSGYFPVQF